MLSLKKIIDTLLKPGTIILLLLSYGLLRLIFARRRRLTDWAVLILGVLCFYLFTTIPLANFLIHHLESQHEPISANHNLAGVKFIVVLSGGSRFNPQIPSTSQLNESSALRVAEGIRLFHLLADQPTLIMSGGAGWVQHAVKLGELMVAYARSQGIPPEKLIAENQSCDTHANAIGVKPLVKDAPFLLVTSAAHLPRARRIFQLLGMQPIPAPADFRWQPHYCFKDYLPSGRALINLEAATHEYLGLAYLALWPGRAGK